MARGEVGKVGVSISSLKDMETLLAGIPLGQVSTSMTINGPAAMLLAFYICVAEQQGVPGNRLNGTVQNDILKEYAARGTYVFPPRPSMRLTTDLFAYCKERLPNWNTISISGYHLREAGATAVQELGFTMAHAVAYVDAARAAGLDVADFAPRLSFFFAVFSDFFEEVAKYRAVRKVWTKLVRERFGGTTERAQHFRLHAASSGRQRADLLEPSRRPAPELAPPVEPTRRGRPRPARRRPLVATADDPDPLRLATMDSSRRHDRDGGDAADGHALRDRLGPARARPPARVSGRGARRESHLGGQRRRGAA